MSPPPSDNESPQRRSTARFAPRADSAPEARHFVAGVLRGGGVPDALVADAELGVSELATNAFLHTGSEIEVTVECFADVVRIAVSDESKAPPVLRHPRTNDATGRGLVIVDGIAARWGADRGYRGPGKRVWFDIERSSATGDTS